MYREENFESVVYEFRAKFPTEPKELLVERFFVVGAEDGYCFLASPCSELDLEDDQIEFFERISSGINAPVTTVKRGWVNPFISQLSDRYEIHFYQGDYSPTVNVSDLATTAEHIINVHSRYFPGTDLRVYPGKS